MKANKYPISEYEDLEMSPDDMDTDIRNWHSHLVKVRKDTKCIYCGAPIVKGDFALSEQGFCDGKPFLIHDCIDCADDLIAFQKDEIEFDEYGKRWKTRYKKYTEEMLAEDEKKWGNRDILYELKYCRDYMRDRKIMMTNHDIRFYTYIMQRAYDMLKEQEPKTVLHREDGDYCPRCSTASTRAIGIQKLHLGTSYCPYCGQAVKWE